MAQNWSYISAISTYLPARSETNADLAAFAPTWNMDKVAEKTGILSRRKSDESETALDMACRAAEELFTEQPEYRESIDFLIFCTQTPDYILPTSACIIQDRLGIPSSAGTLDINLGCSGYVYCLGLAKALIESGQRSTILILTADTYTKLIHPLDRSVRSVFGDGAAATIVRSGSDRTSIYSPDLGSDGSGAHNLIVPAGGFRQRDATHEESTDESGNVRTDANLFMNGREILMFTLKRIPGSVAKALANANWSVDELDLLVLHQASKLVIDTLTQRLKVPADRSWNGMSEIGNTVSATIPIALRQAIDAGVLKPGSKVMLSGFGVGYSWGSLAVEWSPDIS
ncbi:ketoacyl-ACP synthase III [Brevundimonas kwangchunensis]|uniref:Ketoacyl-ACP synthase III n=1 Tax=Brevundimonas kwangchunensis TaxID=322163 RepID=A0ABP3RNI6_9CAUL